MWIDSSVIIGILFLLFFIWPLVAGIIYGIYSITATGISKRANKQVDEEVKRIRATHKEADLLKKIEVLEEKIKSEERHLSILKAVELKKYKQELYEKFGREAIELEDYIKELTIQISSREKLKDELDASISQKYPYLAKTIAEYTYLSDLIIAEELLSRPRPAFATAAEIKSKLSKERQQFKLESVLHKNQLDFYENLFPWLLDFKELPPQDAVSIAKDPDKGYAQSDERYWLSPEEYSKLKPVEKSQLALDRWKKRKKTKWEIGIEYEQYIGYLFELKGYRIDYQGAKLGVEDMGIDLIAQKNKELWIIQCKRWNENRTIHEKHIFQLYGTKVLQEIDHPDKKATALFVATEDNLSDIAKKCADRLEVIIRTIPHDDYPLIKCNINNGEKIYHLPMDQQYHRIVIDVSKGEFYAWTAKEAEDAGFRRAIRHRIIN